MGSAVDRKRTLLVAEGVQFEPDGIHIAVASLHYFGDANEAARMPSPKAKKRRRAGDS